MAKTLLLLGGSPQQVIAITTARNLGYRTVLCDYLPDNPGQHEADVFYLVSTTDKDAVLDVARKENIDGIVAYASDPAAPTAAYVSEALGLAGIPYDMALNFCEKHKFRTFLEQNGFNVPGSVELDADAPFDASLVEGLTLPIIVKPTDSSGSKGVTVVRDLADLPAAFEDARERSRNRVLVAEEFIERAHPHVIEAELTVSNGEVSTWGLINSIRDSASNPLLPAAYSYPLELSQDQIDLVYDQVSKLVHASGMNYGSFNIEMIITEDGRLYFLDAGPRNGGNMLPDFISMIADGDVVAATLQAAMGETPDDSAALDGKSGGSWGLAVMHTPQDGILDHIEHTPTAAEALVREVPLAEPGDEVHRFATCDKGFGFAFYHFPDEATKQATMNAPGGPVLAILQD